MLLCLFLVVLECCRQRRASILRGNEGSEKVFPNHILRESQTVHVFTPSQFPANEDYLTQVHWHQGTAKISTTLGAP